MNLGFTAIGRAVRTALVVTSQTCHVLVALFTLYNMISTYDISPTYYLSTMWLNDCTIIWCSFILASDDPLRVCDRTDTYLDISGSSGMADSLGDVTEVHLQSTMSNSKQQLF